MKDDVQIRRLATLEEVKEMQKVEQKVWGMTPIPVHQTLTVAKNGGVILGAFMKNQIIGFNYGFPGYLGGDVYLCSHMTAILPKYRGRGIGERLKRIQKEAARDAGYRKIRWTFDPLESLNAYFNLHKLRASALFFTENMYGNMRNELNEQGLPSDRFTVEWAIAEEPESSSASLAEIDQDNVLLDGRLRDDGLLQPEEKDLNIEGSNVFFAAIPDHFQKMMHHSPKLALSWRQATRNVFQAVMKKSFIAVDFIPDRTRKRGYYQFVKNS